MTPAQIETGIRIDKIRYGFSLGAFLSVGILGRFTECYLLIDLGFWSLTIGRFWG